MRGPSGLVVTLALLLLVAARHASAVLPAAQQKEFVDRHNFWRAAVSPTASNMEALYWSATLAAAAQAWSDLCVFKHSGSQYGENSASSPYTSSDGVPSATVDLWQSEVANYNYSSTSCAAGKVCGHYTQVVWATTNAVGCGVTFCNPLTGSTGSTVAQFSILVVCNYNPAGNMLDMNLNPPRVGSPYIAGPSPPAWATSTATSRSAATVSLSGTITAVQSTSVASVSTTASVAGPSALITASTSVTAVTSSNAGLTASAASTSTASVTRSLSVGVVSTTFGQSITGGGGGTTIGTAQTTSLSTTTRAATAAAASATGTPTSQFIFMITIRTAACIVLSSTLPAWAAAVGISTSRLQIVSYTGCSPQRQSGPYTLRMLVLDDPTGSSARAVASAAAALGGANVLSSEVQTVWLATQAPAQAPSPKAPVQSLTLTVLVVALAIAAGVILLLAGIVACLALRKPPSVIVRSEPLMPAGSAWGSQPMSVLDPPRLSQYGAAPAPRSPRAGPYTRLEDDAVLQALYAAAGASNPLSSYGGR